MRCPVGIERESWGRVGQVSVGWLALISLQELGEEPSPRIPPVAGGNRADLFSKWLLLQFFLVLCFVVA